ncbi:hypothetical protein DRN97_02175 [Methanosarcinales archaeon]|nr:MAG: hypothetical protein DRN97_02175 [Methanosarcinales archaeon]
MQQQKLECSGKMNEKASYLVMEVPLGELMLAELNEYGKYKDVEVQFFDDIAFVIKLLKNCRERGGGDEPRKTK